MTDTVQDTVGRLAIAKENTTMAQKEIANAMQGMFQREYAQREGLINMNPTPISSMDRGIERLELAIHDLKIVRERMIDG
jgi:hypothetical protein